EVLRGDLTGRVADEQPLAVPLVDLVQMPQAAGDLLVELPDAVVLQARLPRSGGEQSPAAPAGDHPGRSALRLGGPLDLQEGADRLRRERLQIDLEVLLAVRQAGRIPRHEARHG